MSDSTLTTTFSKKLPIIIGSVLALALIFGGIIFVRKTLIGNDDYKLPTNLVRSHNPIIGNKDAKIKLVYLYDYQCPACQSNADNMSTLKTEFKDKVAFVYKPFIVHPGSGNRMAQSALAASMQGKFADYNDKLIKQTPDKSNGLSVPELESLASQSGLDKVKFLKDYNSKQVEDDIALDQKDIKETILPESKYAEVKGSLKAASTPTLVLLKDNKFTDSWWSGVINLDDSKRGTEEIKGVRTRINDLINSK